MIAQMLEPTTRCIKDKTPDNNTTQNKTARYNIVQQYKTNQQPNISKQTHKIKPK